MYYITYFGSKISRVSISSGLCGMAHLEVTTDNAKPMYFEYIAEVWQFLCFLTQQGLEETAFEVIFCED